jgi:hypothetical protein
VTNTPTPPTDRTMLPPPAEALIDFVKERAATKAGWREMRRSKRIPVQLEVAVQPLNESLRPSGRPFLAVTRDVSTGGLCLMHARPAPTETLFVEIPRPEVTPLYVVLKVLRNRRVGPFYEIAGEFLPIDADTLVTAQARLEANRPSQSD